MRAKLLHDLEKHSQRENLITLLESPEDLELWKVIKNDPHAGFDELQQYKGEHRKELRKWTRSEYFKAVSNAGEEFGQSVVSDLRKEESTIRKKLEELLGKDLSDYEVYDEVQLFINESNKEYMVADVLLIKRDKNKNIVDFILIENKMSSKAPFTERQIEAFNAVHNAEKTPTKFRVKSRDKESKEKTVLHQFTELTVEKENLVRISGSCETTIDNVTMDRIPKQEEIKR